jgi:hypothetical protein
MSNSKFGSANEYWGYYENQWVLRDVSDNSGSNDKKEQTRYNELLKKNTKNWKMYIHLTPYIDEMSCAILRLMYCDKLLLLHMTQYRCVQGTKSLKK